MSDEISALTLFEVSEGLLKSHGLDGSLGTARLLPPIFGHRRLRWRAPAGSHYH